MKLKKVRNVAKVGMREKTGFKEASLHYLNSTNGQPLLEQLLISN